MDLAVFFGELAGLAVILGLAVLTFVQSSRRAVQRHAQSRFLTLLVGVTSLYLLLASSCSATRYYGWREGLKPPTDWFYLSVSDLLFPAICILLICVIWTLSPRLRKLNPMFANISLGLAVSITFFSSALLFFVGCTQGETTRLQVQWSPDHSMFVRVEEWDAGAIDSFHTSVVVRSWNRLHAWTVFTTELPPQSINVTWKDSTHLVVRDSLWAEERIHQPDPDFKCNDASYVHVVCEAH